MLHVAKHAAEHHKTFAVNLAAPFIMQASRALLASLLLLFPARGAALSPSNRAPRAPNHTPQVPPFKKALMDLMPYIDYLFGNESEALAFAESEGWDTKDVCEIAVRISAFSKARGGALCAAISRGARAGARDDRSPSV